MKTYILKYSEIQTRLSFQKVSRKIYRLFHIILLLSLFLGGFGIRFQTGLANSDPHFVRVQSNLVDRVNRLDIRPVRMIEYPSFAWYELKADDFQKFTNSQIPFQEDFLAGNIRVIGYEFDPQVEGEPDLPADLLSPEEKPERFRLVQFHGPIRDEWYLQLSALGVDILQYYPSNTYLVWASEDAILEATRLPSVRWVGDFHPAYKLNTGSVKLEGLVENIAVTIYDDGYLQNTLEQIESIGGRYIQHFPAQPDRRFWTALYVLDESEIEKVALLSTVWAIEYLPARPGFDDENGTQIIAGNIPGGTPTTGYYNWLTTKGVNGSGIVWADVDTGLNSTHPDITGRVTAYVSYPGGGSANTDSDGHGSHTAGAIFGDGQGGTGIQDPNGFYWGTGAAPEASLVVQNALVGSSWPPTGGWEKISKDSLVNGAIGSSNSWYTGASGAQGYSSIARTHDLMVRDGNFDTASIAEPIIMVFSAGNGGPSATTITEPKEAKNLITVGASSNYPRAGSSVNSVPGFSSRGPAIDGRTLPNVMAPGEKTSSFIGGSSSCTEAVSGAGSSYYTFCSGTSMAAPFVSGGSALIADWWKQEGRGTPSPAMMKALIINGASDMAGGNDGNGGNLTNTPNNIQGWGRLNLNNVIRSGVSTVYRDQIDPLNSTGQSYVLNVGVADPTKPMKISLVWSDGPGAVGANPALVNNLDLQVVSGGNTFLGNRFSGGWSITGGSSDNLNNIENVYIQSPSGGATITVQAVNIAGDGIPYNGDPTDQDFALVCTNCSLFPDFYIGVTPATQSVCIPSNASYQVQIGSVAGFSEQVTLTASGNPGGTTTTFSSNPITPPGTSNLTIGNTGVANSGTYPITIQGVSATKNHSVQAELNITQAIPSAPTGLSPANGAINQAKSLSVNWNPVLSADSYSVQVATDHEFTNIISSASNLNQTSFSPTGLSDSTLYYWRVTAQNPCGSISSPIHSFVTQLSTEVCHDLNLAIPDNNSTGVSDTIANPGSSTISDLDLRVVITHSYVGDLIVSLTHSTTSTGVTAIDRPGVPATGTGCGMNHINTILSDEATLPVENQCVSSTNASPPPYAVDGIYSPNNPLSAFDTQSFSGNWVLNVSDIAGADTGTLTRWCLINNGSSADYSDSLGSYGVAWHTGAGNIRLGSQWSSDTNPTPGSDDPTDDGVIRQGSWISGSTTALSVTANANGWISGWIDWNADGWFDQSERSVDQSVISGVNSIQVSIPASYLTGSTISARFRIYPTQPVGVASVALPEGGAGDGEVEDYVWAFTPTAVQLIGISTRSGWMFPMGVAVTLIFAAIWIFKKKRT